MKTITEEQLQKLEKAIQVRLTSYIDWADEFEYDSRDENNFKELFERLEKDANFTGDIARGIIEDAKKEAGL